MALLLLRLRLYQTSNKSKENVNGNTYLTLVCMCYSRVRFSEFYFPYLKFNKDLLNYLLVRECLLEQRSDQRQRLGLTAHCVDLDTQLKALSCIDPVRWLSARITPVGGCPRRSPG